MIKRGSVADIGVKIQVNPPSNKGAADEKIMPAPPAPGRKKTSGGDKALRIVTTTGGGSNLLGNDLVRPEQSEFKLKRNIDPNDRGRPMIDWIRRASAFSGNYSDVKSFKEISSEELSKHCISTDAWMALRGEVYDVTEYISFHPGGVKEIMKGVGIDATALFNSIHRYVNFESILKGKQVGIYSPSVRYSSPSAGGGPLVITNLPPSTSAQNAKKVPEYDDAMIPTTEFSEDHTSCYYTVNLKNLKYTEDYWNVAVLKKNTLLLKVITTPPEMWVGYYKLQEALLEDAINIKFAKRFRTMTLELKKPKSRIWKSIGDPLPDSNLIMDSRFTVDDRNPCIPVARVNIARDIVLLGIEISSSARIGVPVGFDVKITAVEEEVSRRYTPIPLLFHYKLYHYNSEKEVLYFIVKIYPDGKMTQILSNMKIYKPNLLQIGYSGGNFNSDWLHGADIHFLFAAGSGLTPFIGITQFFVDHNIAIGASHVVLVHWSKEEEDLIWKEEFEELDRQKRWFKYAPALTKIGDDASWKGLRGRISTELFKQIIDLVPTAKKKKNRVKFMTCGPEGFNATVAETIEQAGYPLNSTFIFLG